VLNRTTGRTLPSQAIRSVSHLVLARFGSVPASQYFEPKGAYRIAPGPAPSGSVFLVNRSTTRRVAFGKRVHQSCAHPATSGTRKLSVPGRVHSIPKSCGSLEALSLPGANPFLTRGTVESPAKCLELKRTAASNQTVGLFVQPLCWLTAVLKIQPLFIGLVASSGGNMRFSS